MIMHTRFFLAFGLLAFLALPASAQESEKIRVLIVDGQNNHAVWPKSTIMMRTYLEEAGLFDVTVERTGFLWKAEDEQEWLPLAQTGEGQLLAQPKRDPAFAPDFARYDVVISNFGWRTAKWPEKTERAFERFVANGGGFVAVHAASNAFPNWDAYNRMIGLGGWGGRDEKAGPYVYFNSEGKMVRDEAPGPAGAHGPRHAFPITIREADHPITRGMPPEWMASRDECYAKLRGPALNMTVLATCKDQTDRAPTGHHEPAMMVLNYEQGRVFHITLGHDAESFEGVGLITALLRGTEWAATGTVTQPVPEDFPTADTVSERAFSPSQEAQ